MESAWQAEETRETARLFCYKKDELTIIFRFFQRFSLTHHEVTFNAMCAAHQLPCASLILKLCELFYPTDETLRFGTFLRAYSYLTLSSELEVWEAVFHMYDTNEHEFWTINEYSEFAEDVDDEMNPVLCKYLSLMKESLLSMTVTEFCAHIHGNIAHFGHLAQGLHRLGTMVLPEEFLKDLHFRFMFRDEILHYFESRGEYPPLPPCKKLWRMLCRRDLSPFESDFPRRGVADVPLRFPEFAQLVMHRRTVSREVYSMSNENPLISRSRGGSMSLQRSMTLQIPSTEERLSHIETSSIQAHISHGPRSSGYGLNRRIERSRTKSGSIKALLVRQRSSMQP